ncbi:hypothetical protein HPP92_008360 [Vanilla planifolia]|uniref:Uncharacterized protein n=1 Tax=Vanilla planifolia TaxID=51239 RepID=A0A835R2C7_VANPL|nr:hypothetical protein HPP92_008360 [Vanilla planifolia]
MITTAWNVRCETSATLARLQRLSSLRYRSASPILTEPFMRDQIPSVCRKLRGTGGGLRSTAGKNVAGRGGMILCRRQSSYANPSSAASRWRPPSASSASRNTFRTTSGCFGKTSQPALTSRRSDPWWICGDFNVSRTPATSRASLLWVLGAGSSSAVSGSIFTEGGNRNGKTLLARLDYFLTDPVALDLARTAAFLSVWDPRTSRGGFQITGDPISGGSFTRFSGKLTRDSRRTRRGGTSAVLAMFRQQRGGGEATRPRAGALRLALSRAGPAWQVASLNLSSILAREEVRREELASGGQRDGSLGFWLLPRGKSASAGNP